MSILQNADYEDSPQSVRKELYEIYANTSATKRTKKRLIEGLDEIYGYDLLFLVGLIIKTEFTGNLNIINQADEVSGITFNEGKITRIDLNDKETFMGELLVSDGLITREQLQTALQDKTRPLGETLVLSKIVSLEQLIKTLMKQMRLRLSRYINETKYRVNFSEADPEIKTIFLTYRDFLEIAHDQVAGRFSPDWLKLHYMELSGGKIEFLNPNEINSVEHLPLIKDLQQFINPKMNDQNFSKVFDYIKSEKEQDYFLKCIHYATMAGRVAVLSDAKTNSEHILKKIYQVCNNKSGVELVETLAHILKCKPTEIDLIFQSVNNYVMSYEGEDLDMKNNMFRIILEMLSKKNFYTIEVNKKYSTQPPASVNTNQFDKDLVDIQNDLLNKKATSAMEKIRRIFTHASNIPKIKLYLIWAKCVLNYESNIKINLNELERDFLQILPEDKDTAEYYYVKSLLHLIRRENTIAEENYLKSVKMNPLFKNYPPLKNARSILKNFFKLSVLILALYPLTGKAAAENRPPFVYLNQYFNYQLQQSDQIQIGDSHFNMNDFKVIDNGDNYDISFTDSLENFNQSIEIGTFTGTPLKYSVVKNAKDSGKLSFNKKKFDNPMFCATKANDYTQIRICKTSSSTDSEASKEVLVSGKKVEPIGSIILNDALDKAVVYARFNQGSYFELTTAKRLALPKTVIKKAGETDFDVTFVDGKNTSQTWNDKISISQTFFKVPNDDLITIKQGIYFNNYVNSATVVEKNYAVKEAAPVAAKNKTSVISLEPLAVFNQIDGKSNEINATLRSGLGLGIGTSFKHTLASHKKIVASALFYTTVMSPTTNQATITNEKLNLLGLTGGYQHFFTDKFSLSGLLRVQEDMFFTKETLTSVLLNKAWTMSLGLQPEYQIYKNQRWTVSALLSGFLMLPNEVPNSEATEMGFLFDGAIKAQYQLNWGYVAAGLHLGDRMQKNAVYDFNDSFLVYRLGLNYQF